MKIKRRRSRCVSRKNIDNATFFRIYEQVLAILDAEFDNRTLTAGSDTDLRDRSVASELDNFFDNSGFQYSPDPFLDFGNPNRNPIVGTETHFIDNPFDNPDSQYIDPSMAFITPIDIPTLIKDFQRIVVELKESDRVNHSLTYAHRVADIIQRRSGDTPLRLIPGQDFETEHKENRNRQLRDLDTENRQLRQLYEDAQWTLHLVMESHRRELQSHFGQDNATSDPSERLNDVDVTSMRQQFYQSAALMARGVNEVLQHEKRMNEAFAQRIEELEMENEVLRCVLESQPGVDADAIVERLERKKLLSSNGSLGNVSTNSSAYLDNHDADATPVKKKSNVMKSLDIK